VFRIPAFQLGRILAGGASHKIKSDKWYFYYRCENCKNNIHEDIIKVLLADILEYDNVVNDMYGDKVLDLDLSKEKDDY
jgi:hypothetical protein